EASPIERSLEGCVHTIGAGVLGSVAGMVPAFLVVLLVGGSVWEGLLVMAGCGAVGAVLVHRLAKRQPGRLDRRVVSAARGVVVGALVPGTAVLVAWVAGLAIDSVRASGIAGFFGGTVPFAVVIGG